MKEISNEIIKVERRTFSHLIAPIGFALMLLIMIFLLKSIEYGRIESWFIALIFVLSIILIPINQIFRVKRIHIYSVVLEEDLIILYQDLLREKRIQVSIEDIEIYIKHTSIRGCDKLLINLPTKVVSQYCNQLWSNELLKEFANKIDDLKSKNPLNSKSSKV